MTGRRARRGNAVIEFTLVGIPIIFVLISIFELARGIWIYHTLAHAIKEGTRYAVVHGNNCVAAPNTCAATIQMIAARIRDAGVGLEPGQLRLTFISSTRTIAENTLTAYLANTQCWPIHATCACGPAACDAGGSAGMDLTITGTYPFQSAIVMFWPGAGGGINFGTYVLPAASTDRIQF